MTEHKELNPWPFIATILFVGLGIIYGLMLLPPATTVAIIVMAFVAYVLGETVAMILNMVYP